jgi:hypothetical protein
MDGSSFGQAMCEIYRGQTCTTTDAEVYGAASSTKLITQHQPIHLSLATFRPDPAATELQVPVYTSKRMG